MSKKYLVAILVVALFATASVSANTAFKKFTATERPDYKLVVNGSNAELKNNPVTIDGVTYLPLREVATILDQDVNFDKGTISLNSKEESESEIMNSTIETVNLDDYIGLRDLSTISDAKFIIGATDTHKNTLIIEKGSNIIEIYNFAGYADPTLANLETNTSQNVNVYFTPKITYIERSFLIKNGVINQ